MRVEEMFAHTMSRWDQRIVHDQDFDGLRLLRRPVKSIMDVGANVGQSIVSFRVTFPNAAVTSFEANPMLHSILEDVADRVRGAVTIKRFGLSECAGAFTLHIPHVGDEAFLEEASIRKEYFDVEWVAQKYRERGGLRLVAVEAAVRVGDDCSLTPDIIKIDVEGAEAMVVRGLLKTLQASQPALLVENSDFHTVTAILAPLGYKPYCYKDGKLEPLLGATTNTIYLGPRDQSCVTQ